MDSKEELNADGHSHNVVAENSDTMALQKKRARRVSFAEMTSVHFFDRDEEYNETPLTESAKISDDSDGEMGFGGQSERNKESRGEDDGDDNDDDDEDEMEMRRSFLRPVGSPSPGGSTFGSASSNDEDNFFGPVSANFIRPGRLSDSGASDDNHDVTMDSTAFSMHFRSLARSECGADLKTPTGGQLFLEEKTPTNPDKGSSMIFTLGKKPIPRSLPGTEASVSHSSNDMSLVGENPNKYDYEKLSPGLDALLEESRKNLLSFGVSDDITTSVSPKRKEVEVLRLVDHRDNLVNSIDHLKNGTGLINSRHVLKGNESAALGESREALDPEGTFPSGRSPEKVSSSTEGAAASNRDDSKPNSSPYEIKNGSESPLVESTSSPVKPQQNLLRISSPSKHLAVEFPLPEKPGSLLRNDSVDHQETETSIQRSISKLELLEKSAFSSTFSARVDNSIIKSLASLRSPNIDTFSGKISHVSGISFVEDSVNEEKLACAHKSKETSYAFSMGHTKAETMNHINGENHLEEHLGRIMGGKSPNELSSRNFPTEQLKYEAAAASPSKITWSGNNMMRDLFTFKQSQEDTLTTETESLLAEIASGDGGKAVFTPKFVSSPGRLLGKKLSASPGLYSSQSKDLLFHSQFNQISEFDKGRHSTSERNLADVNLSTPTAKIDITKGMKRELISPLVEVNHSRNLIELKAADRGEFDIYNRKGIFETIDKFITPSKENKSEVMHSKILDVGNQISKDISRAKDNLDGEGLRAISQGSASPSARRNLDEPKFLKNRLESPKASSPRKELENKQSPRIKSPITTQLSGRLEHFSATKRNLELFLRDTQHRTEIARVQKSPKLQKRENRDPEMLLHPNEGRTTLTAPDRKTWTDTCSNFSEDLEVLISGSADKLNSKMIDALEAMLFHQQRSKIYEMLRLGAMPQNTVVIQDLQFENVAEINSLLHRLVFEKAKLQLKHVKRGRLLKRLQILSSRIQESQILRANMSSQPLGRSTTDLLVDAVDDQPLSVNLMKGHKVCPENLTAMRQASEALDRKILNLMRSFHASCKMKAEPSCGETIALVNAHLIKRASCRFIRQDMQMWVVHSKASVNGQQCLVLNYLDLIIQSIKIIVGPTSSATVLFELNEANIIKNFTNMDACVAFAYVFNAETTRKYIGAKTLVQETQVTSSLLGTLLDVVEEVQLAQIEFQNLTQSSFSLRSVDRLDLILCFFSFNSGRKVIFTLDMSCLKRGIYPSEILPVELASPVDTQKSLSSGLLFDEIGNALKGVGTGYARILRLCRCVSQVVQEHRKTT